METEYTTKAATFESSLHISSKNTIIFFVTVLFNIFMRQTLTDDFWGGTQKYELRVSYKKFIIKT